MRLSGKGKTMTEVIKNLIKGAGSIMDVYPAADYSKFIPQENAEELMRQSWQRTGDDLKRAIGEYADEQ